MRARWMGEKAVKLMETPSKESKSKVLDFNLKHALLLGLAIPLLLVAACNRTTTAPDSSVTFGKLVTASDVDANNAPTALADTFSPAQKTVYLVAEIKQAAPGARIAASWTRDGTPVQVSPQVVATSGYNQDTNIEFHLNPGAGGFLPGNYKVQLIVNDQPSGASASFTVK
jgi:hypothetical protein